MPPLTPLDIQHKEFTKAMRGYAMHEVDTFLDQVTEEFTRMQDEIARLREQASSAGPAQPAPVVQQAPPPPPPPQPQPVVAEARGGAGGEEAIARALVMAQRMADQTVEEAKVKAKSMVAEAEARAKNMTEQAQMRAREVTEATEQVARRRQELESSIEALRAFERDYRARLRGFVEGQLKALEDAAPAGPVAPPQPPGLGGNSRPLPGADDLPALSTGARQSSYSALRDSTSDQLGHNGRDRVDRLRHDD